MTSSASPGEQPGPSGDLFFNLVEAAALRQERNTPAILQNSSNVSGFSHGAPAASSVHPSLVQFSTPPYGTPLIMMSTPHAMPTAIPCNSLPNISGGTSRQAPNPRREQALHRYQEKRDRVICNILVLLLCSLSAICREDK
jgi:hypothetical protein